MQDHLSFLISHTAVVRNRGILTTDGKTIPRIKTVLVRGMALLSVVRICRGART